VKATFQAESVTAPELSLPPQYAVRTAIDFQAEQRRVASDRMTARPARGIWQW
jgi:hypothetical protein